MKSNIKQTTFDVLDEIHSDTEFNTLDLLQSVTNLDYMRSGEKRNPFPDTILRYIRDYRKSHPVSIICINSLKSRYKLVRYDN